MHVCSYLVCFLLIGFLDCLKRWQPVRFPQPSRQFSKILWSLRKPFCFDYQFCWGGKKSVGGAIQFPCGFQNVVLIERICMAQEFSIVAPYLVFNVYFFTNLSINHFWLHFHRITISYLLYIDSLDTLGTKSLS